MTTALSDLQSKVAEILGTVPIFAAESVLIDDGRVKEDYETTLASRGFVALVGPVLGLETAVRDPQLPMVRATFTVEFYVNPDQNAANAGINILGAIAACSKALVDYDFGLGESKIEALPNLCELSSDTPGVRGYVLLFSKLVSFS